MELCPTALPVLAVSILAPLVFRAWRSKADLLVMGFMNRPGSKGLVAAAELRASGGWFSPHVNFRLRVNTTFADDGLSSRLLDFAKQSVCQGSRGGVPAKEGGTGCVR